MGVVNESVDHGFDGDGVVEDLGDHLREMRSACRKFLSTIGHDSPMDDIWFPEPCHGLPGLHDYSLNQALGELRGVFGVHVAQVSREIPDRCGG